MKKAKMGLTIMIIGWMDASQDNSHIVSDLDDPATLSFVVSSGVLVKETDEWITIARDYFPTPEGAGTNQVRQREVIPKVNIQWIKRVNI